MSNSNKLIGIGMLVGGIILAVRAKQSGPLNGFEGFGSSFKKAVKKTTSSIKKVTDSKTLRPILAVASAGTSELTRKSAGFISDPSKQLKKLNPMTVLSKSPVFSKTLLFRRFAGGKPKSSGQATAAPEEIAYLDAFNQPITEAEYNAIMAVVNKVGSGIVSGPMMNGTYQTWPGNGILSAAEYNLWLRAGGAAAAPNSDQYRSPPLIATNPGQQSSGGGDGTSYTSIVSPSGQAPNDPDYQEAADAFGDGSQSAQTPQSTLLPGAAPAPTEQEYAALPAEAPAPKKLNPFVIGGVLLAVPVLMGMGGK